MSTATSFKILFSITAKPDQTDFSVSYEAISGILLAIRDAAGMRESYCLVFDTPANSGALTLKYDGDDAKEFMCPDEINSVDVAQRETAPNGKLEELIQKILCHLREKGLLKNIAQISVVTTITRVETSEPTIVLEAD